MDKFTDDPKKLKAIRVSINDALAFVEKAHGIKLKIGLNMSYDETTFRTKLEGSLVNDSGTVEDGQRSDFKKFATMFDLNPEWLDKEIVLGDDTFTVTGLNTRASKNVVRIEKENGDIHVCPSKNLKHYFNKVA